MRLTPDHALAVFTASYGDGLDATRAAAALAAVKSEEIRIASAPKWDNEIQHRRQWNRSRPLIDPQLERAEREFGYPRELLIGNSKQRFWRPLRDQFIKWCHEAGASIRAIALAMERSPSDVRAALKRCAAREALSIRHNDGNEQEVRHASRVRESGRATGPERSNEKTQPQTLTGDQPALAQPRTILENKTQEDHNMSRPPSSAAPQERRGTNQTASRVDVLELASARGRSAEQRRASHG